MDAWEHLVATSTAPSGSDAWTHLISPKAGGGSLFIEGLDVIVETSDITTKVDIPAINVIMVEQAVTVKVEPAIQVAVHNQDVQTTINPSIDITLGCK